MSEHLRFRELVLPQLDAGYNLARWLTRNAHDADDVVQDACVRAIQYFDALRGSDARAWFLAIVRNSFYDRCRRDRTHPTISVEEESARIEALADPGAIDPELAAVRSEQSRQLALAMARLPLAYREIVILRDLEDLSYKEIASVLAVPIGTVMSRLARARALLQEVLLAPGAVTTGQRGQE